MLDSGTLKFAGAVSLGAVTAISVSKYLQNQAKGQNPKELLRKVPKKWIKVGEISKFTLYPVKSCKGVDVPEVEATALGIKASTYLRDRIFLVVNSESEYRTQRNFPKMCLIGVAIHGNQLTLSAPEKPCITVTIPEYDPSIVKSCRVAADSVATALDCGNEIGQWLSEYLGAEGLRLYLHHGEKTQRDMVGLQQKFPAFLPEDKGSFQDETSFMMIAENSLEKLNLHLEQPVTMKNFRPSIIIRGTPEPFSEDLWTYIRIGEEDGPVMKTARPCIRCKLTTVDPETGEFINTGEPLKTLIQLKRPLGDDQLDAMCNNRAVLGNHFGLLRPGRLIRVGDPVYTAVV